MSSGPKYGKFAQSDIEPILLLLPQIEKVREEFQALIQQHPEKFAEKFQTTGFAWAHLYEVPFLQLLFNFIAVAGLGKDVAHATVSASMICAIPGPPGTGSRGLAATS